MKVDNSTLVEIGICQVNISPKGSNNEVNVPNLDDIVVVVMGVVANLSEKTPCMETIS